MNKGLWGKKHTLKFSSPQPTTVHLRHCESPGSRESSWDTGDNYK